jgi:hypothetical protein
MAEETKTEETTETEQTQETQVAETKTTEPTETEQLRKQVEELQASSSELQSKFDTLSQDSTRREQYIEQISPYVDFDGLKTAGQDTDSSEEDQSFLTKAEAKALEQKITQTIATAEFQREFRVKYPDLGDKGPKEEMVRFFFENKTLRTDSFDKRLESAVNSTRNLLKTEQEKALKEKEAADEKAAKEAKEKEEAAAKASGLSSGTITSPQKTEKESETTSDYINERRETQQKLKG